MSNNDASNSPFEIFRRNLKPLMVLLTILALFSFVVLPVVQTAMNKSRGGGGDEVIARFGGIDVTRNRVEYFTRNHNQAIRFLQEIGEETISRGGQPKVAGFRQNPQTNQIDSVGIPMQPSPELTVRTLAYANAARENGFDLDDSSLGRWLEDYTDRQFSPRDIDAKLMRSTGNQMARQHLYEQLRNHLLANVYNRRGAATLVSSQGMEIKTPLQQWEAFQKLRRNATINAYGVLVDDYISKTNADPSPTQVSEVYEQGKNRDSSDQSPLPAFHQRATATMQSVVGDFETFISQEVEKIGEDELRAEYERRRTGGDFQLPTDDELALEADTEAMIEDVETSDQPIETGEDGEDGDDGDAAAEMSSEDQTTDEPSAEQSSTEVSELGDAAEADQADAEMAEEDTADEDTETAPDSTPEKEGVEQPTAVEETTADKVDLDGPDSETPEADEAAGEKTEQAEEGDQSALSSRRATTLVAMMQDDADEESDDPETETPEVSTEDADGDAGDDQSPSEKADESATGTEDGDDMPASDNKPADKTAEDSADETPDEDDGPKFRSFEEVKDEIARDLARPKAEARWTAASNEINSAMRRYFTEYAIWEGNSKGDAEKAGDPPARPDLKSMADKFGFEIIEIGPVTEVSIADEPIAESYGLGGPNRVRGFAFRYEMFGIPSQGRPGQPLFSPLRTIDDQTGKIYVTWKIAETEEKTPTLEEVRSDVVDYIRRQEAKELAKAAAEKLVQQINQSDAELSTLPAEDRKDNYYEGLGPFAYLQMVGRFQIAMGNVPELDSVGEDFMKAVFATEVGEAAMAMNQPERVVYVVVPTKFEPSIDDLKEQFRQPINRQMASMVASGTNEIQNGFVKTVESETGLEEMFQ